jgi:hypothetical protein
MFPGGMTIPVKSASPEERRPRAFARGLEDGAILLRGALSRNVAGMRPLEGSIYENSSDLMTIGTTPGGVIMAPTST